MHLGQIDFGSGKAHGPDTHLRPWTFFYIVFVNIAQVFAFELCPDPLPLSSTSWR